MIYLLERKKIMKTLNTKRLKISGKVYEIGPKNPYYRKFIPYYNQRVKKEPLVSKIIESMKEYGSCTMYQPILVDEDCKVRDGQHTMDAAIHLNLPYHVLIVPKNFKHMIPINTIQQRWLDADFTNYWIAEGREPYRIFKEIRDANPYISHGILVMMFAKSRTRTGGGSSKQFKKGNLHLYHLDYVNKCIGMFRQIENRAKITPILPNIFATQMFQQALLKAFNNDDFNFSKFKKGLTRNDHMLNILGRTPELYDEVIRLEGLG
tara:strand:- start:20 stop:811 length:792 start_codon:yes stop_codon:yes gene_type:complete